MKLSSAQQTVLDKMDENKSPFHFIPWGLNYCQLRDKDHEYLGRVRYCVFDALKNKDLINYNNGWYKS